jgi:hypothetical protein
MIGLVKRHVSTLLIALFFVLFVLNGTFMLDPDFGWEVPTGNYILKHGIPLTDPFSYSMPSYHFVDHEWLTHIGFALLLPRIGMFGLAVIVAAIATLALIIATRRSNKYWQPIQILLLGLLLIQFVMVRPQAITFMFYACVSQLILHDDLWKKWRYYMPILFLFWANLHGGFVIGLGTLVVFVVLKKHQTRRKMALEVGILLLSGAATLINPYGIRLWHEVLLSVTDTRLRFTVNEWMPTLIVIEPTVWIIIAVMVSYFLATQKKLALHFRVLFILLFVSGLSSYRNIPLFAVVAITMSPLFYEEIRKTTLSSKVFQANLIKFHMVFLQILLVMTILYLGLLYPLNIRRYNELMNYPAKAVQYLKTHRHEGNLLSLYEWGGYLLQHYPNHKVFVDGRMPSWRQKLSTGQNESEDVTRLYRNLFTNLTPFGPTLNKFHITRLLIRKSSISFTKNEKMNIEAKKLKKQLDVNQFRIIYQDSSVVLYQR